MRRSDGPSRPTADVGFGAFLSAIRRQRGFWLIAASTAAFALSLFATEGAGTMLWALGIGLLIAAGIGYPRFRRRGGHL